MFRSVSVLLERQSPEGGAMAHAREWAGRLRLPLRSVPAWTAPEFFRPFELSIFDGTLPAPRRQALLARSLRTPQSTLLACPPAWRPLSRVLILNQHGWPGDGFVDAVAGLCRSFQATPVVLTVARTVAEAKVRERAAEEAFARRRLVVDCDFVAGCDAATAVARAAHWRRCSHVFVERRPVPGWPRWLRRDVLRDLAGLSDALAVVAVPNAPFLPAPREVQAAVVPPQEGTGSSLTPQGDTQWD